ncbi:nucleotide exchange factor GrpE [cf. Phormidesmis sp. LEGE 11477]|uniref:nucleotide exchange factor GrpE n=1 Tax=cf. Phormidesmis sp. LEGE 11477 TaxID=1828680 RepID=UPI00188153CE|nr:nucleotide exchange factor GrpE [cf. Phormidesmis sp. LEGE 11477]MBE9062676.1 nucleotide exchange factor GrpE [cf. Phormidesmis sp. LEGE 11477]
MIDADKNDNQQGAEESAENIEELRVEDASADIDFEQTFDSASEPVGESAGEPTVGNDSVDDDISFEDAFSAEAEARVALQQQTESLQSQLEERSGQFARLTADFDNFRKRTLKERETLEEQVKCNTINGLLEVVDNFERARSQIKPQSEGELAIHKSYQGVYKQLVEALKKLGVSPMRSEGKEFDPNLHEAVMREPTSDYPEGTVIEEFVRGYVLGERVLRHAMVKVATPLDSTAESG